MPPDHGNAVESLINRLDLHIQERVCVRADKPFASSRGFLTIPREQQSSARLAHTRFHPLIGGVFPAALQCDFYTRGSVWLNLGGGWDNTLLAQFSSLHIKRKNQTSGPPLKGLQVCGINETRYGQESARGHGTPRSKESSPVYTHALNCTSTGRLRPMNEWSS